MLAGWGPEFDPASAATWVARGRLPEHAEGLAAAWRQFPDLPSDAPLADRLERSRARMAALRPVNDAMAAKVDADRQASNFASVERRERAGEGDDSDLAILRGRDAYGFSWDLSVRYARGWWDAHNGRVHHYSEAVPCREPQALRNSAYDQGFKDGGGDRSDLFDAARRTYRARLRESNQPPPCAPAVVARPLPSSWPKPTDAARPVRWSRRLLILSDADVSGEGDAGGAKWDFLAIVQAWPEAVDALVLVLTNEGFVDARGFAGAMRSPVAARPRAEVAGHQLRIALSGRDFDDVLTTLQGDDLVLLDSIAREIPLCRSMERAQNSRLQRRSHLRTWLGRGLGQASNRAGGHIRWGTTYELATGKLGEFVARHVGPVPGRGHLVRIEVRGGLASGYGTAEGQLLSPEIFVSSKSRLRPEIAAALRAFAAATPLMGVAAVERS